MSEPRDIRLKRMKMRAARRGTKEMDLILGPFGASQLDAMAPEELDLFDRLLEENDNDLWLWVTGKAPAPGEYAALLARIRDHAGLT